MHYDSASIHLPVTNDVSVRIVMVLALMAGWKGKKSDVKGAFLKGSLDPGQERMFMYVLKGFEEFYDEDEVLELLKAIHGTKKAAMAFWKELLLACMKDMKNKRNRADPC